MLENTKYNHMWLGAKIIGTEHSYVIAWTNHNNMSGEQDYMNWRVNGKHNVEPNDYNLEDSKASCLRFNVQKGNA